MSNNIPKGTSLYAAYRADLAYDRLEFWRVEAQRLEDRADTMRSKSARTKQLKLAQAASHNADRAAVDFQRWQHRAETLAAREEMEARRRRRPVRGEEPKKKQAPKKKAPVGKLPVYDARDVRKGAELGYAKTLKEAERVADKAAPDGEELESVREGRGPSNRRAYIAVYRRIPKAKRKRFEYLLKVSYEAGRRGASARAHNVWWDVRFRKRDSSRATQAELEYAVRRIHLGEVPNGWDVLSIAWDRGNRSAGAVPDREATTANELKNAMASLGATMDSRGGIAWEDHRGEYVGANYTIGEEELDAN